MHTCDILHGAGIALYASSIYFVEFDAVINQRKGGLIGKQDTGIREW